MRPLVRLLISLGIETVKNVVGKITNVRNMAETIIEIGHAWCPRWRRIIRGYHKTVTILPSTDKIWQGIFLTDFACARIGDFDLDMSGIGSVDARYYDRVICTVNSE